MSQDGLSPEQSGVEPSTSIASGDALVASAPAPIVPPAPERNPVDSTGPRAPRMLDELDLTSAERRFRRRVALPLALFFATCATTFYAGASGWQAGAGGTPLPDLIRAEGWRGLVYMLAVMATISAHEMGHFLMTVRYRIPSTYPLFIPMPFGLTGTMGAVISMDGLRADRRQLFDIGIAGPLAGLVLTVPLVCIGIRTADRIPDGVLQAEANGPMDTRMHFGQPLMVKLLLPVLQPAWPENSEFEPNALYMAGWVGMLITGLNMMPVSQLDGGHVLYALLKRRARRWARVFLLSAIAATIVFDNYFYAMMLILVIVLGVDHPPTANDHAELGLGRWLLGWASLVIPVLCFIPKPL